MADAPDDLPQLAQLRAPCDVRNDGAACPNTGAYSMVIHCERCQQAPEHRLVCARCMTTLVAHGVRCSQCGDPLGIGPMARLGA